MKDTNLKLSTTPAHEKDKKTGKVNIYKQQMITH